MRTFSENTPTRHRLARVARIPLVLALGVASLLVTPAGAAEPDETVEAAVKNKQDQAAAEVAYATFLATNPPVTCNPRSREARGTPQTTVFPVGRFFAHDAAAWSVQCASVNEPLPSYDLELEIAFQVWNHTIKDFVDIPNTAARCLRPSNLGQAVILDCVNEVTYVEDHDSIGPPHRARFTIVQPYDPPHTFYSDEWQSRFEPHCQLAGALCM